MHQYFTYYIYYYKLNNHTKSFLLVALQFICIFLMLLTTKYKSFSIVASILLIASIALVSWALLAMKKSRFRFSPVPADDAVLIIRGPYKYIRHPMYSAIILSTIGLLLIDFTWYRFGIGIFLTMILILKLQWEEKMLLNAFKSYRHYMKNTKRIIPFFY